MLHTTHSEINLYDYEKLITSEIDRNINFFGLPKEKYNYEGIIFEPFQLSDLNFLGEEILRDENSYETFNFTEVYNYKPHYIAQQYYGNPRLAYLILYANNIEEITEFNTYNLGSTIRIIKFNVLLTLSDIMDTNNIKKPEIIAIGETIVKDF